MSHWRNRIRFSVTEFGHTFFQTIQDADVLLRTEANMPKSNALPETGFVRLPSIIGPQGPIPIGKSTWWEGVKSGRFPKPIKLGPRITAWRVDEIRGLIAQLSADGEQ